jgi:hypothetical protein
MAGQEDSLEIARDKSMSGWVIQEARILDAHGCLPIHCYQHRVALIGQIRNVKLDTGRVMRDAVAENPRCEIQDIPYPASARVTPT